LFDIPHAGTRGRGKPYWRERRSFSIVLMAPVRRPLASGGNGLVWEL